MAGELQAFLDWLNHNSAAVTAIATVIYVFFTILLWFATKRQATLTRQMFEASHIPYLNVRVEDPVDTGEKGVLSFRMIIDNQGPVIAHIVKWELSASLTGHKLQVHSIDEHLDYPIGPSDPTLVPGQKRVMQCRFNNQLFPDTYFPLTFKAIVAYRGAGDRLYFTDFAAHCQSRSWTSQKCEMRRRRNILLRALGIKNEI
jgi:hypothetical protein